MSEQQCALGSEFRAPFDVAHTPHAPEVSCELVLTCEKLCGCEWIQKWDPLELVITLQHGGNAEQSRVFPDVVMRRSGLCSVGHALVMEEWCVEVAEYAHRVEDDQ